MYREFQDFCNVEPHTILYLASTRQMSLLSVVNRIVEQWEPLRLFFTFNCMEHSEEIYLHINNSGIKLFYIFLQWVLPKFVDFNKYCQGYKLLIHIFTIHILKLYFYERCRLFLITSYQEIKKHYDFNDPVLSKINT